MAADRRLTVYLIRHGETFWNREGRCQGVTDVPLTEKGYRQAHAIAKAFEGKQLSLILSGPLQRTRETAVIIAELHGLSVEIREELREWNQGELEGLTGVELLGNHRAYFERWRQDPAQTTPPGGESLQALQDRAWPVIDSLRERALEGSRGCRESHYDDRDHPLCCPWSQPCPYSSSQARCGLTEHDHICPVQPLFRVGAHHSQ